MKNNILQQLIKEEVSSFFRRSDNNLISEQSFNHQNILSHWEKVTSGVPANSYDEYDLGSGVITDACIYVYEHGIVSLATVDRYLSKFIEMLVGNFGDDPRIGDDVEAIMYDLRDFDLPRVRKTFSELFISEKDPSFLSKTNNNLISETRGGYFDYDDDGYSHHDYDNYNDDNEHSRHDYDDYNDGHSHHDEMLDCWNAVRSGVPDDYYDLESITEACVYVYAQGIVPLSVVDNYLSEFLRMLFEEFGEGEGSEKFENDVDSMMNRLHDLNMPKTEKVYSQLFLSDQALVYSSMFPPE